MKLVKSYHVAYAVNALANFCKKYEVEIRPHILAHFAIAWREREFFEWTPSGKAFRRITARLLDDDVKVETTIALVFKGDTIEKELTKELNDKIMAATSGEWIPQK